VLSGHFLPLPLRLLENESPEEKFPSCELTRPFSLHAFKAFQAVGFFPLVHAEMQGLGNANNTAASRELFSGLNFEPLSNA